MYLSIVTTLYHSASHLEEFYKRVGAEAEKITCDYEMIFVNDGSPDHSLEIALALHQKDKRVKVIDLSRNFGHHKAIMTGLAHTKGDLVFLIDSDLEEKPEFLHKFHEMLKTKQADAVYGIQESRRGKFFERISGAVFYRLFNLLSTYPVPQNPITARLMSRRYVNALIRFQDQEVFLGGLFLIAGFKQVPVAVNKLANSDTTYSVTRKISLFVNAITSFSNRPLVHIFYLGSFIFFCSSIAAFYLIIRRTFFGIYLSGWPSLIVSIWMLGGLTIFCVGIVGVYLAKVFMEVKQRPYTIIRETYGFSEKIESIKMINSSVGNGY